MDKIIRTMIKNRKEPASGRGNVYTGFFRIMQEITNFVSNEMAVPAAVRMTPGKGRYWKRKNNHLCVVCGKVNEDEKASCPECRARQNEDARQARVFYKSLGLCSECGKNRVFKNEKMCPECRAKKITTYHRTEEQRERYYASNRKWYWRLSEQGICVKCGKRKAVEGKKMCGICASKAAARIRKSRMEKRYQAIDLKARIPRAEWYENGLCYMCGSSMDMDGVKVCTKCYEKLRYARSKKTPRNQYSKIIYSKKSVRGCDAATENAFTCK